MKPTVGDFLRLIEERDIPADTPVCISVSLADGGHADTFEPMFVSRVRHDGSHEVAIEGELFAVQPPPD